jgi:hypothetical protein
MVPSGKSKDIDKRQMNHLLILQNQVLKLVGVFFKHLWRHYDLPTILPSPKGLQLVREVNLTDNKVNTTSQVWAGHTNIGSMWLLFLRSH